MLAAVQRHLPQMALSDCSSLRVWATGPGEDRQSFAQSFDVERRSIRATFDEFFANPKDYMDVMEAPREEAEKLAAEIRLVPSSAKDELYGFLFKRLETPYQAVIECLKRPESEWLQPLLVPDNPEYTPPAQPNPTAVLGGIVLLRLFGMLGVEDPVDHLPRMLARYRMQIRLLNLYATIREYRWLNHRLPVSLAEVFGKEPIDPATLQPYVYEQREGDDFRVYLKTAELGDVDLVYKATRSKDSEPPPPFDLPASNP
jgi:hypothetical protein